MIKRLLVILCLCSSAWATTTVSGNLKNLGGGSISLGTFVRFYLRGCAGNQPRINGTALIAPTLGNVYYVDFVPNVFGAISGTIYSTTDATGTGNGDVECGGLKTGLWYGMVPFLNGKSGPETPIAAKNTFTIDISNITPITANPVVLAPTGDTTYCRLDGGNCDLNTNSHALNTTSITQANYQRDCRLDGTIDTTGAADSAATINSCITNAVTNQQSNIYLPCGKLLLNSAINLTNRPGLRLKGCSDQFQISSQSAIASVGVTILLCNSGTVCIDTTGSGDIKVSDLELYLAGTGISTPTPIGILQGRDNAGGGGAGNPFCFAERQVYDNIAIIDFTASAPNTTANGSRGYIGFYNVAAEQDTWNDIFIYSATNMVFADTNVLSISSPYQTLATGCPATMNTATLKNILLESTSSLTQNHIENTNGINFNWTGLVMIGGGGGIKFGGASQSTTGWHVFGDFEQVNATSYYVITSVNLLDCIFRSAASASLTAMVNPTANNLQFLNNQFDWHQTVTPAFTNTSTGTLVGGGILSTAATNTLSNVKLVGVNVYAPQVARSTQTFASGSTYFLGASDGNFAVGNFATTGILAASPSAATCGGAGDVCVSRTTTTGEVCIGSNGSQCLDFGLSSTGNWTINSGNLIVPKYQTAPNCSAVGTAASPSLVACGAASAGQFSCATNATGATCVISTTAVTANSEIFVLESDTAATGTRLGVTCNTSTTVNPATRILATITAGTSFTINLGTVTTNPACFSYFIVN